MLESVVGQQSMRPEHCLNCDGTHEMKILHVITGMQKAAGTSVFCGELLNEFAKAGEDCRLLVQSKSDDFYSVDDRVKIFVDVVRRVSADGWFPDIVHIHALWSPWLSKVYRWAKSIDAKVVWSPHGMLTPWALGQRKWKKRLALALYQFWGLRGADLIHVTAESEVEDMRRLGLKNKVVIVPLGVHVPPVCPTRQEKAMKIVLFVSRVHPKKGLFDLIDAWGALKPQGWRLVIAGPSHETHADDVINRARMLGLGEDVVHYIGSVFGEAKDRLYATSDIFVLPTYSENFGVVVLEALAQGCPVLTTKETPWQSLEEKGCGWWIDVGVRRLTEALQKVLLLPRSELIEKGRRGYAFARMNYSWHKHAQSMIDAYRVLGGHTVELSWKANTSRPRL